jgi:uncharacterized protein YndB with AHSA1/START domain
MTPGPFAAFIDDELGKAIQRADGRYDIVFQRRIKKPIEKVWAALTIPERLAEWFGIVDLELRVGGRYHISWEGEDYRIEGEIIELEPLRRLVHTWPDGTDTPAICRYELEPDGDGCRLRFANEGVPAQYVSSIAGWHAFFEALPGAAEGIRTKWTMEHEREILQRYKHLLPETEPQQ